ncbi:DUF72 domain-containing protein [Flagellimonas aquimarina]|uniref:DUF72 domain-containing protein n=1 Tax=Flagellimonas aquimarina TaxID=2201895 RepID=A0A316KYL6_9FLAO|nr:DUF72 domain-containing protein [Allomuricauda koreensis]PWL38954.1 DUF72 domain-containing protein [Allomuricauda koreensis]
MKFGKVEQPELIDFTIPKDHPETSVLLSKNKKDQQTNFYVGCAKWNRQDLKNFYPRGTKDELVYYSSQFNCIELNATFYRIFPAEQYQKWYDKTPDGFKFFPKMTNEVSHLRRLNDKVYEIADRYLEVTSLLKDKLGTIFLQMHNNFGPKNWDRVVQFVEYWPKEFPLAIEFRHTDWFNDEKVAQELYYLLQENNIANVLVDTAGRRDLMHMRLTNNEAFIRYVGANHASDYPRLDDWITRLSKWETLGLSNIHFFVHQNLELESPLLSAYFIEKLNKKFGSNLTIPNTLVQNKPNTLF